MKKYEEVKDHSINKEEVIVIRKKISTIINKNKKIFYILGICAGILIGAATFNTIDKCCEIDNNKPIAMTGEEVVDIVVVDKNDKKAYDYWEHLSKYKKLAESENITLDNLEYCSYDYANIASYIMADEEPDIAIYGIYYYIGDNAEINMDGVIKTLSYFDRNNEILSDDYSTFKEYLKAKGFIDKNGEIDYVNYERRSKNKILNLLISKEIKTIREGKSLVKKS
ncbi:MAG: hypothetical protein RR478_05655 [Bacilli bacterium]